MATVKAVLRKPNKQGYCPINIKYTHLQAHNSLATGLSIEKKYFDSETGLVLLSFANAPAINAKLQAIKSKLMAIADGLVAAGVEPLHQRVIAEYKADLERKPRKKKLKKISRNSNATKKLENKNGLPFALFEEVEAPEYRRRIVDNILSRYISEKAVGDRSIEVLHEFVSDEGKIIELKDEEGNVVYKRTKPKRDYVINESDSLKQVVTTQAIEGAEVRKALQQILPHEVFHTYFKTKTDLESWIRYNEAKAVSPDTVRQRKSFSNSLLKFIIDMKYKLSYEDINQQFYKDYADWLMFGKEKGISKNDCYNSTFGSHIKRLINFLGYCDDVLNESVNSAYKKFKVLEEEKDVITLEGYEIDMLYNFVMEGEPPYGKPWKIYQDLCVFGCLSGLRISDINRSLFDLNTLHRKKYLTARPKKTINRVKAAYYKVPLFLDTRIEEILQRYDYNLQSFTDKLTGRSFKIKVSEFNEVIKIILEQMYKALGINLHPIVILKYKLTTEYPIHTFKWKEFSSHCCRRSAITNWYYDRKLTKDEILKILGSKSYKELDRYIKDSDIDFLDRLKTKLDRVI